jgi:hypothetical protein
LPASLAGGAGARPDHPISGPQLVPDQSPFCAEKHDAFGLMCIHYDQPEGLRRRANDT